MLDLLEKARADQQSLLYSARRIGEEQGRQEGAHEKAVEIATALLSIGHPGAIVAQVSKLPLDEVKAIAASLAS